MNILRKKILSIVISLLGIIMLCAGFYYKHKLNVAKTGTVFLKNNPFGDVTSSYGDHKFRPYELKIHLILASGAIFTALGLGYYFHIRRKY